MSRWARGRWDLQRLHLFGQDLAVDAARRGVQEPTAGDEDQGEARLAQPTVRSFGIPPEDAEGPEAMPATGKGAILDSLGGRIGTWKVALVGHEHQGAAAGAAAVGSDRPGARRSDRRGHGDSEPPGRPAQRAARDEPAEPGDPA